MHPRTYAWMVMAILLCVVSATLIKTIDRAIFGHRPNRAAVQTVLPSTSDPPPANTAAVRRPPPATSAGDQHWEALKVLSEASVAQQRALDHIGRWKAEIEPQLSDDNGANVAVNHDLVRKLAFVVNQKRSTEEEVKSAAEQINLLQDRVKSAAEKSPPETLTAREMYEVRQQHSMTTKAARDWLSAIDQANAILLTGWYGANPVMEPTLQQSLERIRSEGILDELDEEIITETETPAKETPETEAIFETSYIDPELRAAALSSDVKSALSPFIARRRIQPSLAGRFSIKFLRTTDKAPMSLGRLMSIGALDDSVAGLKKLALIGGNRKLPEPKWSIASQPNNWTEDDEEFLKNAQQMLRDHASILVSEGVLSP